MSYTPNDSESTFNVLQPTIVRIDRIVDESKTTKSFFFNGNIEYEPGQFIILSNRASQHNPHRSAYLRKMSRVSCNLI